MSSAERQSAILENPSLCTFLHFSSGLGWLDKRKALKQFRCALDCCERSCRLFFPVSAFSCDSVVNSSYSVWKETLGGETTRLDMISLRFFFLLSFFRHL